MATLRVLQDGATGAAVEVPWALYERGRLAQRGRGPASAWPAATRREAVLAASVVRLAHVKLPPMSAERVVQAAAFALEDQLAGPAGAHHLAVSPRTGDGFDVAIVGRTIAASLAKGFDRVVAEPALADKPAAGTWRWYRSGAAGGFVRRADGSAFAVGSVERGRGLPLELTLPLRQARAAQPPLARVDVAFAVDDAQLQAWSDEAGIPFARGAPWRWDAEQVDEAAGFDLLQGEFARTRVPAPDRARRRFRWAATLAAAALVVYVGGAIVQWTSLRLRYWQAQRELVATVRQAGVADAADARAAAAALAARFAEARHRAGLAAPADALPLLARAAPALALLPAGAIRSATYASGAWTIDLGKTDPAQAGAAERTLRLAGLSTLTATTAAGTRMRIGASEALPD